MSVDGTVAVRQHTSADRLIDNEVAPGDLYRQRVVFPRFPLATVTSVAVTTASTQLLAANDDRRKVHVWADGTSNSVLIKFGTAASATSFTWKVPGGAGVVFDYPMYTGVITAVTDSGTLNCRVTEVT